MLHFYDNDFRSPDGEYLLLAANGLFLIANGKRAEALFQPYASKGLRWLHPYYLPTQTAGRGRVTKFFQYLWFTDEKNWEAPLGGKLKKRLFPVYYHEDEVLPEGDIFYLVAQNGVFLVKKSQFFISCTPVLSAIAGKKIDWLLPLKSTVHLTLPRKIPYSEMEKIVAFFLKVYDEYPGCEAFIHICWDTLKEDYFFYVPEQVVDKGFVGYKNRLLPPEIIRLGDIHSHGKGWAYHSEQDNKDEKNDDGIHITIGTIDKVPSYSCSVVSDGARAIFDASVMIEFPTINIEVPKEWLEKVKLYVYTPPIQTYTSTIRINGRYPYVDYQNPTNYSPKPLRRAGRASKK